MFTMWTNDMCTYLVKTHSEYFKMEHINKMYDILEFYLYYHYDVSLKYKFM